MTARANRQALRWLWVWLHRYVGLSIAAFVAIAGLTGSVLAYIEPLREWLVPDRFVATAAGQPLGIAALTRAVEAHDPRLRIVQWPLELRSGRVASFDVAAAPTSGGDEPRTLPFDAVHVDPVSGRVLGTTLGNDGAPVAARVLDFLYALHFSLALPGRIGHWIMGIAALLWFLDCFVGAWLTLPRGRPLLAKWKPAWAVRRRRFNFDLHRAAGLWFFAMLAILALSSVQMNLNDEIFMPAARTVLALSPDPLDARRTGEKRGVASVQLSPDAALACARAEAARRHWRDTPERMQRDDAQDLYRIVFRTPPDEWTTATRRELYLDATDGRVLAAYQPGRGTVGDTAIDWLAALHVGTVLGWPYKLLLCVTGIVIAALSVTGVIVWHRKRRARLHGRR